MGTSEHPPHQSALERSWPDNVKREDKLLEQYPSWSIKRLRAEGESALRPTTYEATDGVVTVRSLDLGAVLDLMEKAIRESGPRTQEGEEGEG
jgi:hypothetical protein